MFVWSWLRRNNTEIDNLIFTVQRLLSEAREIRVIPLESHESGDHLAIFKL